MPRALYMSALLFALAIPAWAQQPPKLEPLPEPPPPPPGMELDPFLEPQVTIIKRGTDTVEEYRQNGHIWMIRIVPINGPIQTFVTNDGSGRLVRDPNEGPVSPVYYTLYQWK